MSLELRLHILRTVIERMVQGAAGPVGTLNEDTFPFYLALAVEPLPAEEKPAEKVKLTDLKWGKERGTLEREIHVSIKAAIPASL
ncbi:MAG TPA: hypothetical protein VJ385_08430, partial [Fibrobacteria bacterium]|nr:hypothetical protein [Fibrobacteria bacterium]